ncbi:MAG: hypothetical protein JNM57_09800 [Cyclobacteriaceae bacterium]|nr:hypothetical protein [Cyclobacteriaceae bacterium]
MLRQKSIDYVLAFSLGGIFLVITNVLQRYETFALLTAYFFAFVIYAWIIYRTREDSVDFWFYAALALRGSLLFAVPNLSEDFYRYLWDGRLLAAGIHPFAEVPSYYMHHGVVIPGINQELFQHLNSPNYFTIYPPVAQFIFWLAAQLSPDSIYGGLVVMKVLVFFAEAGSLILLKNILTLKNIPSKNILFYALNPLVILELSGNIHLEAFLILFLLFSLYYLLSNKLYSAAISFALAICIKLIPLIFLPLIPFFVGWKRTLQFYFIAGVVSLLLFLPLLNQEIFDGFNHSLGYYFKKFEFNASLYYLVREAGYWVVGYNIIQTAGWALGVIAGIAILWISFFRMKITVNGTELSAAQFQNLTNRLLFTLLIYFTFSTIVHPWYITTLVAIATFTHYRFVLLWSALAFLTYAGYTPNGFQENLWIVALEYLLVFGYLVYELLWKKESSSSVAYY